MKKALAFKLQVGPIYLGASSLAIIVSLGQIHQTASDKLSVFKALRAGVSTYYPHINRTVSVLTYLGGMDTVLFCCYTIR